MRGAGIVGLELNNLVAVLHAQVVLDQQSASFGAAHVGVDIIRLGADSVVETARGLRRVVLVDQTHAVLVRRFGVR